MARSSLRPHGRGTKVLALLCSSLLACTTVRTHVSTIAPEVALREGHAVLQLDLWVESNRPLTPEEEVRYRAEARQALEQAVAGRSQTEGGGQLVVRSMGVTRTSGRRGDQVGAAVGIAVGIVAVVVVVIVALVSDGNGGGGKSSAKAPPRVAPPPRVSGVRPPTPRTGGLAPPRFSPAPRLPSAAAPRGRPRLVPGAPRSPHLHGGPAVDVGIGLGWWVPLGPVPPPVPPPSETASPPPPSGEVAPPPEGQAQAEASEPSAPETRTMQLAPPEPLPVERRGFFDGDRLVLDAVMVDPATGEVRWSKRVARSVDPRDVKAVRAVVDELFADGGWTAAVPPRS